MRLIQQFESNSIEETEKFAHELAARFQANDIVLLEGELGSGKTFLVKALCKIWQTEDEAVSPSFAIVHQYRGALPVNHLDLYRIHDERELDQLGWEELLDCGAVTFIEWPQILEAHLENFYKIRIELQGEKRIFSLLSFNEYI